MAQNQEDEWVTTAMADDSAVADLLIRFRHVHPPPPPKQASLSPPPLLWTVKQPRSKATARTSPTTPLSWSGVTSASGGSEDSSRPAPPSKLSGAARSKASGAGGLKIDKRSRKKKTLKELKEEETLLVEERTHLKRQLATLRVTLENRRAVNESLKRYKIDMQSRQSQPALERVLVSHSIEANQMQLQDASFVHPSSSILPQEIRNDSCESLKRLHPTVENSFGKFVLPDLNLPFDEHSNIKVI